MMLKGLKLPYNGENIGEINSRTRGYFFNYI